MKGRRSVVVFTIIVVLLGAVVIVALGFRTHHANTESVMPEFSIVSDDKLEIISETRIFFGHQSVGENIVSGVNYIMEENEKKYLKIVEDKDLSSVFGNGFVHAKIGRNTRPESKIRAFRKVLQSDPECNVDIALLKFCYVDVNRDSDPADLFRKYQAGIAELNGLCPETVFVHVTVPIESAPLGLKNTVKDWVKIILRRPSVTEDNRVRERYNQLLRDAYSGREPVFDIALIESIGPDGKRSYRGRPSDRVFLMDRRYTTDGGHLNQVGRVHVAEQLLMTLACVAHPEDGE